MSNKKEIHLTPKEILALNDDDLLKRKEELAETLLEAMDYQDEEKIKSYELEMFMITNVIRARDLEI